MTSPAIQTDRNAAESVFYTMIGNNRVMLDKILSGRADDHALVQAFARHRLAALDEAAERVDKLITTYRESGVDECMGWITPLKHARGVIVALKETPDAK